MRLQGEKAIKSLCTVPHLELKDFREPHIKENVCCLCYNVSWNDRWFANFTCVKLSFGSLCIGFHEVIFFFFLISMRAGSLSFPFMHHYFGAEYKNSPPCASYQDFLLLLFSTYCIVLNFTFMPTMQFEITFTYSVRLGQGWFFIFCLWISSWYSIIYWKGYLSSELVLYLCENSVERICVSLFLSHLFCCIDLYVSLSTNTTPSWL